MGRYFFHYRGQSQTLVELTAKEYREVADEKDTDEEDAAPAYEPVHWTSAHEWVKRGGHHSTPLYIDEGRIRYARDGY